ncbi:MAG: uridine diphosphate-N-acetylglucosamine-binding protein YvcK [Bryobacteraceae bacterium]
MGGGSGLSTLLRGLKRYVRESAGGIQLTAVVTVTDDGGSSGRLRRDFDVLPPGDIRNCMVALAPDETLISRLFQYRFASGRGLKGHSFGNLFLTAMTDLTGDFSHAVKLSSDVLSVLGRIYPSTAANVRLEAVLADGSRVAGETKISRSKQRIEKVLLKPGGAKPLPETLKAIAEADLITLGPGSLFTSVIPNLLVDGIADAIAASPALKAYFVNLMSQPGETTGFLASDHADAILRHSIKRSRSKGSIIDLVVLNKGAIRDGVLRRYRAQAARPIENDSKRISELGLAVQWEDLVRMPVAPVNGKIRHDPGALAAVTVELALQGRRRRASKPKKRTSAKP